MIRSLLRFAWDSVLRFIYLANNELSSDERHYVLRSAVAHPPPNDLSCIRLIRGEDSFASDYMRDLAGAFLDNGEVGVGYYEEDAVVGFFWIKPGGGVEQVGREAINVPADCSILHHLVVSEAHRGRGIATALLQSLPSILPNCMAEKIIAFVRRENAPSLKAFRKSCFEVVGSISSKRVGGKRVYCCDCPDFTLSADGETEYRSLFARSIQCPLHIVTRPLLATKPLVGGVAGDLPWQSILAGTILKNSLPGVLHVTSRAGVPFLLPCSVSPGSRFWKFRIKVEPISFQPWPLTRGLRPSEVVNAVSQSARSPFIEELEWALPFDIGEQLDKEKPACQNIRYSFDSWILDNDGPYDLIFKTKFNSTIRNGIRRSAARGVEIVEDPTPDQVRVFADLWNDSYEGRGWNGFHFGADFFLAVSHLLNKRGRLLLALLEGKIIAGALFLDEHEGSIYLCSALNREYKDVFPIYAIFAQAIGKMCAEGKRFLHMGGVGSNKQLAVFKQHWGAEPKPIRALQLCRAPGGLPPLGVIADKVGRRLVAMTFARLRKRFERTIAL